jgi:hypothetical protein
MYKKIIRIAAVFALILATATLSVAAGPKQTGTVVVVTEGVADVKAADGTVYKVKVEDIIADNLKNGDVVEYDLVQGTPVHVAKKPAK